MRSSAMRVLLTFLAAMLLALPAHAAAPRALRVFVSVAISPDGTRVASIEGDAPPGGGSPSLYQLVIRTADGSHRSSIPMPCGAVKDCTPFDPVWEPDSRHIVFVLRLPGDSFAHAVYRLDLAGGTLKRLVTFAGPVSTLRFASNGTLAMLVTPNATKDVGAVAPGAEVVGDLDAAPAEQRIAILRDGKLGFASPPDLYVYEYAWRPDGSGLVGTAAPGDGDQNWWSAKLYAFDAATAAARVIYTPSSPQQQLTLPVVSPDGKQVAFIGGLMSDFDAVAGDAYVMPLDDPHPVARDVTPNWTVSVVSLGWGCRDGTLRAGLQAGSETQMVTLADTPSAAPLSVEQSAEDRLQGGDEFVSVACKPDRVATIRQDYQTPPEIAVGPMGQWRNITSLNVGVMPPAADRTLPIAWQHDGFSQQGWLLLPRRAAPPAGLPMITIVHGGPGAAQTPYFLGAGLIRDMLTAGYAVFLPNPRGSFGQGTAFTTAIVRNMGHGVLADILAGVDAAEHAAPIDDHRLGIGGWSYGGYMAMFAGTQTDRFRAAYAGAGISDWQSYYGQTGIDGWMLPFFGASVYDDPAIYAQASPMTYIKQARVPTFLAVGQRDIECPPAQTIEMWHALRDLGVPTNAVIYAGEGHNFRDAGHIADVSRRIVAWFGAYLGPKPP
jgi:dipeptidyl aminopeptidase/acylaminoacyl peptidase